MNRIKEINAEIKALIKEKAELLLNRHDYTGVPYHLHATLRDQYGIDLPHDCATRKFIDGLVERSITECRNQVHEIVYELYAYGKARKWLDKIGTGDNVVDKLESLVLHAIKLAERDNKKE